MNGTVTVERDGREVVAGQAESVRLKITGPSRHAEPSHLNFDWSSRKVYVERNKMMIRVAKPTMS